MQIQGHSAIVTGGGSGLGEAVARALAAAGAKVAVLDVNTAGAQRVAADIELAGIVADDNGVAQQAVGCDAAPQRALGGDARGCEAALEPVDAKLLQMRRTGRGGGEVPHRAVGQACDLRASPRSRIR